MADWNWMHRVHQMINPVAKLFNDALLLIYHGYHFPS